MILSKRIFNITFFALTFITLFSLGCITWKSNTIPSSKDIVLPTNKRFKIAISFNGCFPEDKISCNSYENFELLKKEFSKSGIIDQVNGSLLGLITSDYHFDLYWEEGSEDNPLALLSIYSLGVIPSYSKSNIKLLAIVKKPNGNIVKTFEYVETKKSLLHILLIFAIPFVDSVSNREIKTDIMKLLLKDLATNI
ncbi:hypothetical protein EHQ24_18795 [Leptospira noumeaensis]|uniref:Lipoprotein n=1 Tax=Leptospira noumeaensis TaxID=2484964 RepID=A0A4R9I0D7_9LEPT|nr:hypothetical protein [Leptospira noumeaensis]TGK78595.1 hypothetical protein EHQ24_18795 [Leptospira noumeaensis]